MNLFTYGTLMFPEIWQRVAGKPPEAVPAILAGYAIRCVQNDLFPVIYHSEAEQVPGLLYLDLSDEVLGILDRYESEIYQREVAVVTLCEGGATDCQTYVLAQDYQHLASVEPWTAEWFQREAKAEYLQRL